MFFEKQGLQVLWQCGKLYYEEYKKHESNSVKVLAFVNRMDLAYATADVIISRAGAGSVSELCLVGKPVIFVPSPNVAEDHQTKNAEALMAQKAALMLKERDLDDRTDRPRISSTALRPSVTLHSERRMSTTLLPAALALLIGLDNPADTFSPDPTVLAQEASSKDKRPSSSKKSQPQKKIETKITIGLIAIRKP